MHYFCLCDYLEQQLCFVKLSCQKDPLCASYACPPPHQQADSRVPPMHQMLLLCLFVGALVAGLSLSILGAYQMEPLELTQQSSLGCREDRTRTISQLLLTSSSRHVTQGTVYRNRSAKIGVASYQRSIMIYLLTETSRRHCSCKHIVREVRPQQRSA